MEKKNISEAKPEWKPVPKRTEWEHGSGKMTQTKRARWLRQYHQDNPDAKARNVVLPTATTQKLHRAGTPSKHAWPSPITKAVVAGTTRGIHQGFESGSAQDRVERIKHKMTDIRRQIAIAKRAGRSTAAHEADMAKLNAHLKKAMGRVATAKNAQDKFHDQVMKHGGGEVRPHLPEQEATPDAVTEAFERLLKTKTLDAISEVRKQVAATIFEESLDEAKKEHPIPGLNKWNMYAGGTAGGGKHSYDHHLNDGDIDKPTSHTQYSISPVTHSNGRFKGYHVGAWSPKAGHSHKSLGMVSDPREGVKLAKAHYDQHFGTKTEEYRLDETGGIATGTFAKQAGEYEKKMKWAMSFDALQEAPKVAGPAHYSLHKELTGAGFAVKKHRKSDGHSFYTHLEKGEVEVHPSGYWDHVQKSGQATSGFYPDKKPNV